MKNLNLTYKKISKKSYSNLNAINEKIMEFKKHIKNAKIKDIISIDESCVMSNMSNNYGWSTKGTKIVQYIKSNPKKHNILMAIDCKKIIAHEINSENINKNIFVNFLKEKLLPTIKNKYILMDNICFHRSKEVIKLINESSNKIIYTPPYSPQFNPIENIFHIIKHKIRQEMCTINKKSINQIINSEKSMSNYRKIFNNSLKYS